jgi:inorganic pyrophosphatase
MNNLQKLKPFDKESLNVIIETPRGSRSKFTWDEKTLMFKLDGLLPMGAVFPYDFGFIPSTKGEDGDPLDVLVLLDEPVFTGCLVPSRLIGVIKAEQKEKDGETVRNDRYIAAAERSTIYESIKDIKDLEKNITEQIEHFFKSYNEQKGKKFKVISTEGPETALKQIKKSIKK